MDIWIDDKRSSSTLSQYGYIGFHIACNCHLILASSATNYRLTTKKLLLYVVVVRKVYNNI